jgi:hypothetical protein
VTLPVSITGGGSQIAVGSSSAPSGGAGPVQRLQLVRPSAPCPSCAHAPVCSIRPLIDEAIPEYRTPPTPHEALHVRVSIELTCDYYLEGDSPTPADPIPVRADMAARRSSAARGHAANAGRSRLKLEDVVASLRETSGNRGASATALGVARPSIDRFVETHELPVDVRDLIDARRRK